MTGDGTYTYQWDAEGRLKSVNNGAARSYIYNALGREVEWHGDGRVSEDLTDLAGHYLGSVDPSTGAWTGERIPGSSIYLAWYVNGGTTFFHYNALGSSMMNTHQDGNTVSNDVLFYPWGQMWASPVNDYFQFFGNIEGWDWEIGEGVTPNRYYPNYQGRWLSPDPLAGDISNPQSLNLYAYALNNPTSLTDPLGLQGCPGGSHSIGSGQCESNYTGGEEMWFPLSWLWDPFSLIDIPAKGFWFWNGEWGREDMGNGFSAAVAGGWLTKDDLATLPLPDLTNILRGLSPTTCSGEATFSAVGPDQATDAGALAAFGIPGHQTGGVAVNPAIFGLPLPGGKGNIGVQRQLAGMSPFISIYPNGLNLYGGPHPPYAISDIGDRNIRNSASPRFDLYGFPSQKSALQFGRQIVPTIILVSGGLPCPTGFSGGQK